MEVADGLLNCYITDEMYSSIMAKQTSQDQMRELYSHLNSADAKQKLYDILEKKFSSLVKDLKSGSGQA